ncbi:hypothetical protein LIA77_08501 [Sarocladium implicatum]|nr:hypothetical protein LIA77_08501 [Sarocladium implicatum]
MSKGCFTVRPDACMHAAVPHSRVTSLMAGFGAAASGTNRLIGKPKLKAALNCLRQAFGDGQMPNDAAGLGHQSPVKEAHITAPDESRVSRPARQPPGSRYRTTAAVNAFSGLLLLSSPSWPAPLPPPADRLSLVLGPLSPFPSSSLAHTSYTPSLSLLSTTAHPNPTHHRRGLSKPHPLNPHPPSTRSTTRQEARIDRLLAIVHLCPRHPVLTSSSTCQPHLTVVSDLPLEPTPRSAFLAEPWPDCIYASSLPQRTRLLCR